MNVLALTPCLYGTSPGQRFRIEQWAPYLEKAGIHFTFMPFEDKALHQVIYQPGHYVGKALLMLRAFFRRLSLATRVRDYDVVFLYREASVLGPAIVEQLIARMNVPIVYDFDDPIWLPYQSPSNGTFSRLKFTGKTASICRLARAVTVGNRLLASWTARHSQNVHILPSTIEMEQYPAKPANSVPPSTLTLGWTGSHSTLPFLKLLEKPLQRLATRYRFRLLVISHTHSPALDWVPVEVIGKKWSAVTEAADLHQMDIGLAPFPDTGWTPWRCHGKVLQYMAAGIPTVASSLGIIPDYIHDGDQGFLAATEDDWTQRIAALLEDADLRHRMGARGRETVGDRYSAHVIAPRAGAIFESATTLVNRT
jgi:hypothetical protein